MTEREVNEISRAIGALEATVANLMRMWEANDRQATDGRRVLHGKFDELKDATTAALNGLQNQVSGISARVDGIAKELSAIQPSVTIFDQQRHQNIGSKKMLAFIWTVIVTSIGAVSYSAIEFVKLIWFSAPKH
jgi:hypothetical protein